MVDITVVNEDYKPIFNWGCPALLEKKVQFLWYIASNNVADGM
jgi:hypothetical protein